MKKDEILKRWHPGVVENVEHLTKEYYAGFNAYLAHTKRKDNPYGEGTIEYCRWDYGWLDGKIHWDSL